MLHINTVHVQRETLWVKQLAGEQYKMICSAWACKHTYIAESFVGLCTHSSVWKVSRVHRGECFYRWFVQAHSPVCSALWIAQKSSQFFLWCGKVGGVFGEGGGGMVHVSGGRGLHGSNPWRVGQSSSSTPNSSNHVFMDFDLCTVAQSYWSRNLFPQSWK